MKKVFFILIFISCQDLLFSQTKDIISFKIEWEELAIDNNTGSLMNNNIEKRQFFTTFLLNTKKDTIFINKSEFLSKVDNKNKFTNRFSIDVLSSRANLLIWNKNHTDTISLFFHHKKRSIQVNQDYYFLTNRYYKFLKNKVLKEKNITEIVDFLDDKLGDYFLPDEIFLIGSKSKYKKKFRIKNATIKTIKADSDGFDSWKVSFLYDKKGILKNQKKQINDEFSYIKTRKYIDSEKIIFEIEENTAKRNTITQQEIFFSNQQQKMEQQNVQYGLNITSFMKQKSNKINN
ncbi:hypothetical protein [Capnocytophaga canis]|uniref:hypothetical protein n=1 Tax=Capnocytophaga canis TaxID=1848903 RepID=UPI0037D2D8EE